MRYFLGAALLAVVFGLGFMIGSIGTGFDSAYKVGCAIINEAVAKGELKENRLQEVIRGALATQNMGDKEVGAIGDFARREKNETPCGRALQAMAS